MKPGVEPLLVVYWPTIVPWSLIPKASADVPPSGMNVVGSPPLGRKNAFPFSSVPTTVPAELIPNLMAAVELMFKMVAVGETSELAVKFVKFTLSDVVNPTTVPQLEIPFELVPVPMVVAEF